MILRLMSIFFLASCVAVAECSNAIAQDLFVSAAGANSVLRFDGMTGAPLGEFVAAGDGGLGNPQGIVFGPDGNLYVSSQASNNVLRFDGQTGDFIDVFASVAGMSFPAELVFHGDHLYVSEFGFPGSRVSRFDAATGNFVDHLITSANRADGLEFDASGDIYVSNFGLNSVRKYDGTTGAYVGDFVTVLSGGLFRPLDNLFLPNGEFLVSSFGTGSIKRYDANGIYLNDPISGLNGGPQGLLIGPDGNLYAGDFGNGLINRYDINSFAFIDTFATTNGTSTTNNFVFGPAAIPEPSSIIFMILLGAASIFIRRK